MSSVLTVSAELGTVLEVLLDVIPSLEDVSALASSSAMSECNMLQFYRRQYTIHSLLRACACKGVCVCVCVRVVSATVCKVQLVRVWASSCVQA